MTGQNVRTGGQLVVDCLRLHGIDVVFAVPGESFIPVLNALHDVPDAVRLVVCRQEGGAAFMAEVYGRLTGKPGVLMVTQAVGASNAVIGVHTAGYGETPLLLLVGHIDRALNERLSYQEVDVRRMFGHLAKWTGQIDDTSRVPEYISRAVHIATSGRPGPVVLALGGDMQVETASVDAGGPFTAPRGAPAPADLADLRARLARAKKPLCIIGGGGWTAAAADDFRAFAEKNALPVATGFRRQDLIDNESPSYVGMAGIRMGSHVAKAIGEADLLLVVGQQIVDKLCRDFALIKSPKPDQMLVHVLPAADELGRTCRADLAIAATIPEFCAALKNVEPIDPAPWGARTRALRKALEEFRTLAPVRSRIDLGRIFAWLNDRLPEDTIVCSAAGGASHWVNRCMRFRRFGTHLGPSSGSMGYGGPAAVAAKLIHPERMVIAVTGDCDFIMTGQEFATAVAYGAAAVFIILNNHMYGSQRTHQEHEYPGRVIGSVEVVNPDFPTLARAYGVFGETVKTTAAFAPAFERAVASGGPAIVEIDIDKTDLGAVSPP